MGEAGLLRLRRRIDVISIDSATQRNARKQSVSVFIEENIT